MLGRRSDQRIIGILMSLLLGACSAGHRTASAGDPSQSDDEDGRDDEAGEDEDDADEDQDSDEIGESCASISQTAVTVYRPVDIIFVVDNSTSMKEEIDSIQQRIDQDFARIIADSGVDYRVIMVSLYADTAEQLGAYPMCVSEPLGGAECTGANTPLANGERFFHYSTLVGSGDGACLFLDGFAAPDRGRRGRDPVSSEPWQALAPEGFQAWLRKDAFKSIVFVGDDNLYCSTESAPNEVFTDTHTDHTVSDGRTVLHAAELDQAIVGLSAEHFGTTEDRKYRVHGIIGIGASGALGPKEPIVDVRCQDAAGDSWGYQELAILTGGLRYPVCRHDSYDEIFHALAADAIETSDLTCDWTIPADSDGEELNPFLVNLEYTPGGSSVKSTIPQVPDEASCAKVASGNAWYYDDAENPTRILSCPRLCAALEKDRSGTVDIAFGCQTVVGLL